MADPCNGLAGLLLGHKFQPVYELGAPTFQLETISGEWRGGVALLNASKAQRYVHSECPRCGAIRSAQEATHG